MSIKEIREVLKDIYNFTCIFTTLILLTVIIPVLVCMPFYIIGLKAEAREFNKLTGKNVTWQQAFFVDLKVMEHVKQVESTEDNQIE